jgi:hypothetical protein
MRYWGQSEAAEEYSMVGRGGQTDAARAEIAGV